MTTIFNGREFAKKREQDLKKEVSKLKKGGVTPKLVSILVGEDPASKLYVSLKKKAAERVGCILEVKEFDSSVRFIDLNQLIRFLNREPSVYGIMVQLPFPAGLRAKTKDLIQNIALEKDVDGLRSNSPFIPATVKGILEIMKQAEAEVRPQQGRTLRLRQLRRVVVIGASGMIGKPLIKELRIRNYELRGYDIKTKNLGARTLEADILISATGKTGLIKGDMVKDGVVLIDIGSPKGDVQFNEVVKKASFITPVPGGVGPVTVSCLLENLVEATYNSLTHTQGKGS